MYLCVRVRVRVCVCVRKTFMRTERKEGDKNEKRKSKETGEKRKHKLIHPGKQTARQQDKSRQDKSR